MSKAVLLKYVNLLLILSFLTQVVTIVMIELRPGESVMDFHETNGFILIGLVVVHAILNFGWIKANLLKWRKPAA